MSIPKTVNMERKCFKCENKIFLNPDVRKKENPTAFEPLDQPFDPLTATSPPLFHSKTCMGAPPAIVKSTKLYNYEEERQPFPDEKPEFVARKREQEKKTGTIGGIQTSEFRQLIDDVAYMKGLLEAVIKAFDSALKTNPSNTGSLLFTKASNMTIKKGDEETKTLEEDTEKIQEEQLNEDEDDTTEKVSEYEEEERRDDPPSNN